MDRAARFVLPLLAMLCLAPLLSLSPGLEAAVSPLALLGGAVLGLTLGNPFPRQTKALSRVCLQASVVVLGLSMDLRQVAQAGRNGVGLSLLSIAGIFGLGWVLRRALNIRPATGLLVSAGTAICGGSAIAALSSVVEAPEEDVSVAVGTVFLLNAVALLVFPPLGHLLGLSPRQFGTWAGLAIHDIASVAGAATAYGRGALDVATAVKLSRVLYLAPVALLAAWVRRRQGGSETSVPIPWFVALFLLASAVRSLAPAVAGVAMPIRHVAAAGFALALLSIGASLNRATLRSVGARPLILGAVLWVGVSAGTLAVVWGR